MKAVIKRTRNKEFRFNLIGDNGEKIATSETYTRKAKAIKTLSKYFPEFEVVFKK
jgi:uncharacterized protein YegP (UPF0339 family)